MRTRLSDKSPRAREELVIVLSAAPPSHQPDPDGYLLEHGGDTDSAQGESEDNEDEYDDEEGDGDEEYDLSAKDSPPGQRSEHLSDGEAVRTTKTRPKRDGVGSQGYHELALYPQDVRGTHIYAGPLKKWDRFRVLVEILYGPGEDHIRLIEQMRHRWARFPILPSKLATEDGGVLRSPWLPDGFEAQQEERFRSWYGAYRASSAQQRSRSMPAKNGERMLPRAPGNLVAFLGPAAAQAQVALSQGQAISLDATGSPLSPGQAPAGWMLDIGGIPLAARWAPRNGHVDQLLALAVVPHSDQAYYETEGEKPSEESMKAGAIQLWSFSPGHVGEGSICPPGTQPRRVGAICFDWGRPTRLQWCPVPLSASSAYGIIAVLCGDGVVRVIEAQKHKSFSYRWIESPIASLGDVGEYNVLATCFTWVNINRIAMGHSDGSISLWSVLPELLLQRLPAHNNYVLDICSGYPSKPYLVASNPMGGHSKLVDMSRPSGEMTFVPGPTTSFQPNMLQWNELMQGFMATYPTSSPFNTSVAFLHARYFPTCRTIFTGHSAPMCLSMSPVHPYVLIGSADGSLWSSNVLRKLMNNRLETLFKVKIFENEFRPAQLGDDGGGTTGESEPQPRGAVRILQGFAPEVNENPRAEHVRRLAEQNAAQKGGKKHKKAAEDDFIDDGEVEEQMEREARESTRKNGERPGSLTRIFDASRLVTNEPLTRITVVAWNPNVEFGCWAAVGMGSGLLRVMDLGVE